MAVGTDQTALHLVPRRSAILACAGERLAHVAWVDRCCANFVCLASFVFCFEALKRCTLLAFSWRDRTPLVFGRASRSTSRAARMLWRMCDVSRSVFNLAQLPMHVG